MAAAGAHPRAQAERAVFTCDAVGADQLADDAAEKVALELHSGRAIVGSNQLAVAAVGVFLGAERLALCVRVFERDHPIRSIVGVFRDQAARAQHLLHAAGLVALVGAVQAIEAVLLVHLAGGAEDEAVHGAGFVVDGGEIFLGVIDEANGGAGLRARKQAIHARVFEGNVVLLILGMHDVAFAVVAKLAQVAVRLLDTDGATQQVELADSMLLAARPSPPAGDGPRRRNKHRIAGCTVAGYLKAGDVSGFRTRARESRRATTLGWDPANAFSAKPRNTAGRRI